MDNWLPLSKKAALCGRNGAKKTKESRAKLAVMVPNVGDRVMGPYTRKIHMIVEIRMARNNSPKIVLDTGGEYTVADLWIHFDPYKD